MIKSKDAVVVSNPLPESEPWRGRTGIVAYLNKPSGVMVKMDDNDQRVEFKESELSLVTADAPVEVEWADGSELSRPPVIRHMEVSESGKLSEVSTEQLIDDSGVLAAGGPLDPSEIREISPEEMDKITARLSKETPIRIPDSEMRKFQIPSISINCTTGSDPINPSHYRGDRVMCIIEEFDLDFKLGNVIKYILREKEKAGIVDLRKARWYLDREIAMREDAGE